ncbi:DUF5990 family protein [Streptomyces sp. NPDC085481]|uniref:DUF5990 family protein n=1 Tax=Streptomyces sp. NPDC085481 TaxID=3365727 RepID=UPI0037CE380D
MQIRIEATDLPGRTCAAAPGFPGYSGIHVAVQRRGRGDDLLDPYPGDAPEAVWTLECTAARTEAGVDFKGRCVQGRPGARFLYLTWGAVDEAGTFTMFRRAKLMLDAVDPQTVEAALESGVLVGRLGLTDAKGRPLCAAVRPPRIRWAAASVA